MIDILLLHSLLVTMFESHITISPLQIEFIIVENLETLLIGIFSIALLLLSISTYQRTGLKNILYAATAFGLFAFDVFLEFIIERYYPITYPAQDFLHTSITLAILGLFFISIVKRTRWYSCGPIYDQFQLIIQVKLWMIYFCSGSSIGVKNHARSNPIRKPHNNIEKWIKGIINYTMDSNHFMEFYGISNLIWVLLILLYI